MLTFEGTAHIFGDHVNTDSVIASKYKVGVLDLNEVCKHLMEDLEEGFYHKIGKGDFIVAGENFGCGSSRELAPQVIKEAGIPCVIAKSFARLFYRNAMNIGLFTIECETGAIQSGHRLRVSFADHTISNLSRGDRISFSPIPLKLVEIIQQGGIFAHFAKYGTFENIFQ